MYHKTPEEMAALYRKQPVQTPGAKKEEEKQEEEKGEEKVSPGKKKEAKAERSLDGSDKKK